MSSTACTNVDLPSRGQLIQELCTGVHFASPLLLTLDGCTIEIVCSTDRVRDALQEYFSALLHTPHGAVQIHIHVLDQEAPSFPFPFTSKKPEPGKTKIKEAWAPVAGGRVVRKIITGMVMIFGEGENLVVGPCQEYPNQVINFINNRFIEYKLNQGALLGHAAAVRYQETGIAIAGFSGMGKSTLALHLMNLGADFVSNDRVLIEQTTQEPWMCGVAKWPRINPGTALHNSALHRVMSKDEQARFSTLPPAQLWELEYKYDVLIEDCFGPGRFQLGAPMHRLVLLNWQFGAGPMQAEEISLPKRTELLAALMKKTGLFYLPQDGFPKNQAEQRYLEVLEPCRVLELSGGTDFMLACQKIGEWLTGPDN